MEFNIDNNKLYESLEYIKAVCVAMDSDCENCPMCVPSTRDKCALWINTPDDWNLRKPGSYSAFM